MSGPDVVAPAPGARRLLRWAWRVLTLGLPLLFVVVLAYGLLSKSPNTTIDDSLTRARAAPAPAFDLTVLERGSLGPVLGPRLRTSLADGRLGLRELRGTPVLLNFWASWCVPCREEAPLLERGWRQLGRPAGVLFLGLDMQDVTTDARDFLRTFRVDYLTIRDPSDAVARRYGVTGVPETFFISRQGAVVEHVIGVLTPAQLRNGMAAALSGRPRSAQQGGARKPTR